MRVYSATGIFKNDGATAGFLDGISGLNTLKVGMIEDYRTTWEIFMLKFLIVSGCSLGLVGAAAAADMPHAQPVYQQAQVGKAPIGKSPIGKSPIGKAPIGKAPLVTRG